MELKYKDYKKGVVKIFIDQEIDLWHLSKIINKGDILSGETTRRIIVDHGETKDSYRKKVFLSIRVEDIEWNGALLRVSGKIVDGPEDIPMGDYHSFNIKKGSLITLKKGSWDAYRKLLEKYVKIRDYKILGIVFDRHEMTMARIDNTGYDIISHLYFKNLPKEEQINLIYKDIARSISDEWKKGKYDFLVIGSPHFFKEYLLEAMDPDIKKKAVLINVSYGSEHGIKELMRNKAIQDGFNKIKSINDISLIEELKRSIANGLATYGYEEVKNALESGAAEKLLLTDKYMEYMKGKVPMNNKGKMKEEVISTVHENVHENVNKNVNNDGVNRLDRLLTLAEETKCEINIIDSEEPSQELDALGGIAAILRYRLN